MRPMQYLYAVVLAAIVLYIGGQTVMFIADVIGKLVSAIA